MAEERQTPTRTGKPKKRGLFQRFLKGEEKPVEREDTEEAVYMEDTKEGLVDYISDPEEREEQEASPMKRPTLAGEDTTEDVISMAHFKQLTRKIKTTLAKDRIRIGYPTVQKWGIDSIELYDELLTKDHPSLVVSSRAIMGYNGSTYDILYERPAGSEYDDILGYEPHYEEVNRYGGLIGYTRYLKPLLIRAMDIERDEQEREATDQKMDELEDIDKQLRKRKREVAEEEIELARYAKELSIKREELEQEAKELSRIEEDVAKKAEEIREDVEAYNAYVTELHESYGQYEQEQEALRQKQQANQRYQEDYIAGLEAKVKEYEEGNYYREDVGNYLLDSQQELLNSYSTYFVENMVAMIEHYGLQTDIQGSIIETQHEYLNQMIANLPEETDSPSLLQAYNELQEVEGLSKEDGLQIVKETLEYIKQGKMYAGYKAEAGESEMERVLRNLIQAKDEREIEKNSDLYAQGKMGRQELEAFEQLVTTLRAGEKEHTYSIIHLNSQAMSLVLRYNFTYRYKESEGNQTEQVYYYVTVGNIMDIRVGKSYIKTLQEGNLYPYNIPIASIEKSNQIQLGKLIALVQQASRTQKKAPMPIRVVEEEAGYDKRYERIQRIYAQEEVGKKLAEYKIEVRYGKGQASNLGNYTREDNQGRYISFIGKKGALVLYSNRYQLIKRGDEANMVWGKYTNKVELIEELGNYMKHLQHIFELAPRDLNVMLRPYMTAYDLRTKGVV